MTREPLKDNEKSLSKVDKVVRNPLTVIEPQKWSSDYKAKEEKP